MNIGKKKVNYLMVGILFLFYLFVMNNYLKDNGLQYDEPHYVIEAISIIKDGDLDLKNNYLNKDYKSFYKGNLDPHISLNSQNNHWYSIHGYGLGLLLVPFVIVGKLLNNIPFFVHLFNIIIFLMSFYLLNRILEFEGISNTFNKIILLFFFITLPIVAYVNFLAVENIAFLYIAFTFYNFYLLVKKEEIDSLIFYLFLFFTFLLIFIHVKFLIIQGLSVIFIGLILFLKKHYKKAYILGITFVISLILLLIFNNLLYGKFSFSAMYKGTELSLKYLIPGILGQFFDSQVGLFVNNTLYLLFLYGMIYFYKNKLQAIEYKLLFIYSISLIFFILVLSSIHIIPIHKLINNDFTNSGFVKYMSRVFNYDFIPMWFQMPVSRFIFPLIPLFIYYILIIEKNSFIKILMLILSVFSLIMLIIYLNYPFILFRPNADFEALSPIFELIYKYTHVDFNYIFPNLLSFKLLDLNTIIAVVLFFIWGISSFYSILNKKFFIITIILLSTILVILDYKRYVEIKNNEFLFPANKFYNSIGKLESNIYIYSSKEKVTTNFIYGPYNYIPYGLFKITFYLQGNKHINSIIKLDAYSTYMHRELGSANLYNKITKINNVSFIIFNNYPQSINEFRIFLNNFRGKIKFFGIKLVKLSDKFRINIPLELLNSQTAVVENNVLKAKRTNGYIFYGYKVPLLKGKYKIRIFVNNEKAKGNFDIYDLNSKKVKFHFFLKKDIIFNIKETSYYELRLFNYNLFNIYKIELEKIK